MYKVNFGKYGKIKIVLYCFYEFYHKVTQFRSDARSFIDSKCIYQKR